MVSFPQDSFDFSNSFTAAAFAGPRGDGFAWLL